MIVSQLITEIFTDEMVYKERVGEISEYSRVG